MGGFFPHIGSLNLGYTSLGNTTFTGVLGQIIADVGAGVNGWTLYDDQRGTTTSLIPSMMGGTNDTSSNIYFSLNSPNVVGYNNQTTFFASWVADSVLGTVITSDLGSNYYTISAFVSPTQATLDRNFAQASVNQHYLMEKPQGYIVLKQTSAQKTFYVKIVRPNCYGDLLRFQTWETWDNLAHTGTNSSNMEVVRAYSDGRTKGQTTHVDYIMWLLPDFFGFWGGASTSENIQGITMFWDLFTVGNLNPYRAGDVNCLMQACTNQVLSDIATASSPNGYTYLNFSGAATMLRNANGSTTWLEPSSPGAAGTFPGTCVYQTWPRGKFYLSDTTRSQLDMDGRQEICDVEVYPAFSNGIFTMAEPKRGTMKYVRFPMFNPSGLHLASFGPCDDNNTYIMVRVSFPGTANNRAPVNLDIMSNNVPNGFSFGTFFTSPAGEIVVNTSYSTVFTPRFFLLPINL